MSKQRLIPVLLLLMLFSSISFAINFTLSSQARTGHDVSLFVRVTDIPAYPNGGLYRVNFDFTYPTESCSGVYFDTYQDDYLMGIDNWNSINDLYENRLGSTAIVRMEASTHMPNTSFSDSILCEFVFQNVTESFTIDVSRFVYGLMMYNSSSSSNEPVIDSVMTITTPLIDAGAPSGEAWYITVSPSIDCCDWIDGQNRFGMDEAALDNFDAMDVPEPPAPVSGCYLTAYFDHTGDGYPFGSDYAEDFRALQVLETHDDYRVWDLVIEKGEDYDGTTCETCYLNFGFNNFPDEYRIFLVDPADSNREYDLRAYSDESFEFQFPVPGVEPTVKKEYKIIVYGPYIAEWPIYHDLNCTWNNISVPVRTNTPTGTFPPTELFMPEHEWYLYDHNGESTDIASWELWTTTNNFDMIFREGYWIGVHPDDLPYRVSIAEGEIVPLPVRIPLSRGLNFIGCPHPIIDFDKYLHCLVCHPDHNQMSFYDATTGADPLLQSAIYMKQNDCNEGYIDEQTIKPWYAYQVWSWYDGVELKFIDHTIELGRAAREQFEEFDGFEVTIEAVNSYSADLITSFGVASDATDDFDNKYDLFEPRRSPGGDYVTAYFFNENSEIRFFNSDFRGFLPHGEQHIYNFYVKSSEEGTVELYWNNDIFDDYEMQIVDVNYPEEYINMMDNSSYFYDSESDEVREFRVLLRRRNLEIPEDLSLCAYPNPFNSVLNINYDVSLDNETEIDIFNIEGKIVASTSSVNVDSGYGIFKWNATNEKSGIYFIRLTCGDVTNVRKALLLK